MPRCTVVKKSVTSGSVILVCDLDQEHELIHPKHYDKLEECTWNHAFNKPTPLESTRTSSPPKLPPLKAARKASRSVAASVAAHTAQFEVVSA